MARVVPLLVVAFIVGSLFRMANEFGVGLFRMFGTLGIAVMGLLATQLLTSWQLEGALRELEALLKALPEGWKVKGARGDSRSWQGYLIGPGRVLAVVTSPVADYARGRGLVRALERAAARAHALAQARQGAQPATPCVLLLRRRADEEARRSVSGVLVVDLEGLAAELGRTPEGRAPEDGTFAPDPASLL